MTVTPTDPTLEQALEAVRTYTTSLRQQIENLTRDAATDQERIEALAVELEDAEATIEELEARIRELEGRRRTFIGGCPPAGGSSLAAAQTVVDKWGPGAAVRQYHSTGKAPRPADAGVVHPSWKPTMAQITANWVSIVTADLLEGDSVEVWHEADNKVRGGSLTFTDVVARKNKFYDLVTELRPDLKVVNTLTGQALSNYGKDEWTKWGVVKAHLLGLDADGIHDKVAPLDIPYEDEIERVARFLDANPSYEGWCVPEFGTSRPAYDLTGEQRAAWARKYGTLFVAPQSLVVELDPATYVCLYEYESTPGNRFQDGSPEAIEWQALKDRA